MRPIKLPVLLLIAASAAGCYDFTYSLDPLFSGTRTSIEPRLLGAWVDESDSSTRWLFTVESESTYSVRIDQTGKIWGSFVGQSGRIKGARFLDLYPQEADSACQAKEKALEDLPCLYNLYLAYPVHLLLRLDLTDSTLVIRELDSHEMASHLQRSRRPLEFRSHDEQILIMGRSSQVRALIGAVVDSSAVFDDLWTLRRVNGASASPH